jgi:hypothetical protein
MSGVRAFEKKKAAQQSTLQAARNNTATNRNT